MPRRYFFYIENVSRPLVVTDSDAKEDVGDVISKLQKALNSRKLFMCKTDSDTIICRSSSVRCVHVEEIGEDQCCKTKNNLKKKKLTSDEKNDIVQKVNMELFETQDEEEQPYEEDHWVGPDSEDNEEYSLDDAYLQAGKNEDEDDANIENFDKQEESDDDDAFLKSMSDILDVPASQMDSEETIKDSTSSLEHTASGDMPVVDLKIRKKSPSKKSSSTIIVNGEVVEDVGEGTQNA